MSEKENEAAPYCTPSSVAAPALNIHLPVSTVPLCIPCEAARATVSSVCIAACRVFGCRAGVSERSKRPVCF